MRGWRSLLNHRCMQMPMAICGARAQRQRLPRLLANGVFLDDGPLILAELVRLAQAGVMPTEPMKKRWAQRFLAKPGALKPSACSAS